MNPVTVAEALQLAITTIERLHCASCGVPVSLTQALLSQQRRDGAEVACKDCVTKELTTKGDR